MYIQFIAIALATVCEPQNTVTGLEYFSAHSSSQYVISLASAPFWLAYQLNSFWLAFILAEKYK